MLHTNCACPTFPVQILHRVPRAINIAIGLVDQIEIQILQLQALQRPFKRLLRAVVPGILNPELSGDEQIGFCHHTTAFDRLANGFFIPVSRRRVNQTIARSERSIHTSFAFFGIGHLDRTPKPRSGIRNAVIQCNRGDS